MSISARLVGRSVIVTGAAQGFGETIAEAAAAEGARLTLVDRQADKLEAVARRLRGQGSDALAVVQDIADETGAAAIVAAHLHAYGDIDVLVNNAGVTCFASLADTDRSTWDLVLAVNLGGTLNMSRAVRAAMTAAGGGSIVNLASIAAELGTPGIGAYTVSKAAIKALTRQLAVEWGPYGIRCNSVSPGVSDWTMSGSSTNSADKAGETDLIPAGRLGTRSDIAAAVIFFASDESSYMTGQDLTVDGGVTLNLIGIRRKLDDVRRLAATENRTSEDVTDNA
jgi:NAD(P)-dependent dehydrogenase (short-subunit alcohol dehydrogenase family)